MVMDNIHCGQVLRIAIGTMALGLILMGTSSAVVQTDPTSDIFSWSSGNPASGPSYIDIVSAEITQVDSNHITLKVKVNGNIPSFGWQGYYFYLDTDESSTTGFSNVGSNDIGVDYEVGVRGNSGFPPIFAEIRKNGVAQGSGIPITYAVSGDTISTTISLADIGNPKSFYWIALTTDGVSINDKAPNSGHSIFSISGTSTNPTTQLTTTLLTPSLKRLEVVEEAFNGNAAAAATAGLERTGVGQAFENGYYYVVDWQGDKYVALNGKSDKLAKLILEQRKILKADGTDYIEKKTLVTGETWDVGGGWALTAQVIDAKASPRQAWLVLSYRGVKKDDKVIAQGEIYTYVEKSFAGESDVPLFVTYMDGVFAGATNDMVQVSYTWAISPSIITPKPTIIPTSESESNKIVEAANQYSKIFNSDFWGNEARVRADAFLKSYTDPLSVALKAAKDILTSVLGAAKMNSAAGILDDLSQSHSASSAADNAGLLGGMDVKAKGIGGNTLSEEFTTLANILKENKDPRMQLVVVSNKLELYRDMLNNPEKYDVGVEWSGNVKIKSISKNILLSMLGSAQEFIDALKINYGMEVTQTNTPPSQSSKKIPGFEAFYALIFIPVIAIKMKTRNRR